MLFLLILFLSSLSSVNLVAMDKEQSLVVKLMTIPEMIIQTAIYLDPASMAAFKQTCTQFNKLCHYHTIHPIVISNIDKIQCTKMLSHLAHTHQDRIFNHFFEHNKCKERRAALELLNWPKNSNLQQCMFAHCIGFNEQENMHPDWYKIFNNNIAFTLFCLCDNPNIKNSSNWTALVYATNENDIEIVKILLKNQSIAPNILCSLDSTVLVKAIAWGRTEIAELLIEYQKTNATLSTSNLTPLNAAILEHNETIVTVLLNNQKANPIDNFTISCAFYNGNKKIINLLCNSSFYYCTGLIGFFMCSMMLLKK